MNFMNLKFYGGNMACPACPAIAMAGGAVSAYFGFEREDLRTTTIVITTCLTVVTAIALKVLLGVSICDGNGNFSLRNIAQVGAISLVLGIIYTVGVNFILNRLVPPPKPCCCQH